MSGLQPVERLRRSSNPEEPNRAVPGGSTGCAWTIRLPLPFNRRSAHHKRHAMSPSGAVPMIADHSRDRRAPFSLRL